MTPQPRAALSIRRAVRRSDLDEVRGLMKEYAAGVSVSLCFQNFEEEVTTLPGPYAAPSGLLLLCRIGGRPAGCAGVRRLSDEDAELKRVFVRDSFRGHGAGERLTRRAIQWAFKAGYLRVVLDTLPSMAAAQRMYERMGFRDIEPYRFNPVPGTRFLALDLGPTVLAGRAAVRAPRLSSAGGDSPRG